jgi:hypothetical protein
MFASLKLAVGEELHALREKSESIEVAVEHAFEHATIHGIVASIWNAQGTLAQKLHAIYRAGHAQGDADRLAKTVEAPGDEDLAAKEEALFQRLLARAKDNVKPEQALSIVPPEPVTDTPEAVQPTAQGAE